jgi:hypothetical protein
MTNQDDADLRKRIDRLELKIDQLEHENRTLEKLLVKYAGKGALAETRGELLKRAETDSDALANLRYELIDQHVAMAMKDGCSRNDAIGYAMERFGISSKSTVETALKFMRQKREHTPAPFIMTLEAEAKAEAFRANESEIKAQVQRFERKLPERAWWLKGKGSPVMLSWLTNLLQRKRTPLE